MLNFLFLNNLRFKLKGSVSDKHQIIYSSRNNNKDHYLKYKYLKIASCIKKLSIKHPKPHTCKINLVFKKTNTTEVFKSLGENYQKIAPYRTATTCYIFKKKLYTLLNNFNVTNILNNNVKEPLTLSLKKKKYIFSMSRKSFLNKKDSFFLVNNQIVSFLLFFFKKNVFFTFKKLNPHTKGVEFDSEVKYIIWKMISKYKKKIKYIFLKTFYKSLFFALKLKDPSFFLDWYIKKIEAISPKKHKFMIHIFYILLKKFHRYIFFSSNVKGVFFYISGKIGVSGDSKKRNIFFNFGKHSGSKKNLRINSIKSKIKTFTGVLGVTFNIYF